MFLKKEEKKMKNNILNAFAQMKKNNMKKVDMKDFKLVAYFLIKIAEQEAIADELYDYRGNGYALNFEQNIRPLIDELEECGYEFFYLVDNLEAI